MRLRPQHRRQQEEVTAMLNEIADLRVGNLMTLDPIVIDPEAPVS